MHRLTVIKKLRKRLIEEFENAYGREWRSAGTAKSIEEFIETAPESGFDTELHTDSSVPDIRRWIQDGKYDELLFKYQKAWLEV